MLRWGKNGGLHARRCERPPGGLHHNDRAAVCVQPLQKGLASCQLIRNGRLGDTCPASCLAAAAAAGLPGWNGSGGGVSEEGCAPGGVGGNACGRRLQAATPRLEPAGVEGGVDLLASGSELLHGCRGPLGQCRLEDSHRGAHVRRQRRAEPRRRLKLSDCCHLMLRPHLGVRARGERDREGAQREAEQRRGAVWAGLAEAPPPLKLCRLLLGPWVSRRPARRRYRCFNAPALALGGPRARVLKQGCLFSPR